MNKISRIREQGQKDKVSIRYHEYFFINQAHSALRLDISSYTPGNHGGMIITYSYGMKRHRSCSLLFRAYVGSQ